jgi:predicted CXXCH cytochrome family protein
MKGLKLSLIILAATLLIGMSGMAYAFHSGGVAECEGCHSMHSPKSGGSFLLVGVDQSSTCLTCHQGANDTGPSSYHISTADSKLTPGLAPLQRTPGGDFGWLKKTYTYSYTSGTPPVTTNYTEEGAIHGHNIVAGDFGYLADSRNTEAPGGSFASGQLACNSCHDPHGQYRRLPSGLIAKTGAPIKASGSYNGAAGANEPTATEAVGVYRLLAGPGYTKGGVTFTGVPAAKSPSTYNQSEVTNQVRVAYGVALTGGHSTWGNWCGTCHTGMHTTGGNYVHPVDQNLGSTIAGLYNTYVKSGDMTGLKVSAFTSLVPFATSSGNYIDLAVLASNSGASLAGPETVDQVNCMSCHRAHASGFLHSLRFDQGYEFMTKNGLYIGSDNPAVGTTGRGPLQSRGRVNAEWQAAYYDRPPTVFATYQRVLCNKCHAKD